MPDNARIDTDLLTQVNEFLGTSMQRTALFAQGMLGKGSQVRVVNGNTTF